MSKIVRSSQTIDSIWPQLDRIFCMLPSLGTVVLVNKAWKEVGKNMRAEWESAVRAMNLTVAPFAKPSPRTFALLFNTQIDEKYIEKFVQPVECDESSEEGEYCVYQPSSPMYSPTSPTYLNL